MHSTPDRGLFYAHARLCCWPLLFISAGELCWPEPCSLEMQGMQEAAETLQSVASGRHPALTSSQPA